MPTASQNSTVYLMFLNGILFLALNWCARRMVMPTDSELQNSKSRGYALLVFAFVVLTLQQEYRCLVYTGFAPDTARNLLLGGFVIPVFALSLVYYRIKKNRAGSRQSPPETNNLPQP